jgi:hypothetical protein
MLGFDRFEHDDAGIVFRDLITLALCGFVVCVVLIMPHINPPVTKTAQDTDPPGNVIVEVRWPDELDSDVDLWVEAPGDVPVGYSNKGGVIFNLLRDDLGKRADATGMNYEVSYSRGIAAGEYTVNVHLYRNTAGACFRSRSRWSPASRNRPRNRHVSCSPATSSWYARARSSPSIASG